MKTYREFTEEPTNVTGPNVAGINKDDTPGPAKLCRRDKFAGCDVFEVSPDDFIKAREGKKKFSRMKRYFDNVKDGIGKEVHDFSKKNPNKSIIVRNEKTKSMFFLKRGK